MNFLIYVEIPTVLCGEAINDKEIYFVKKKNKKKQTTNKRKFIKWKGEERRGDRQPRNLAAINFLRSFRIRPVLIQEIILSEDI